MSDDQPLPSPYTPLYQAEHGARFERRRLIQEYEATYDCNLIVFADVIFPDGVVYFEELLSELQPGRDLHILLRSPGGDGETAIRMLRSAQSRCRRLTVVLPDQAKSAATLFTLGAHSILMGPISDLGPVDPQFPFRGRGLVAGKDIIAAVDNAARAVQGAPETYPL